VARHLVRLKLRLLRSGLASVGIRGKVAFGVAYLFAVAVGLGAGALFAGLRVVDEPSFDSLVPFGLGVLFLMWAFGPVITIASENTLEVDRLALFPLGPGQMMPGLLLGSMVGFGGLATALTLVGVVIGTAPSSGRAVLTVAAVVVEFGVCVAASRLVSTALSAATRKRRYRDVALTIVPLSFFVLNLALRAATPSSGVPQLDRPRLLWELLPSGPGAAAVVAARDGRVGVAVVALAGAVAVLAALVWLWWLAVNRVLTTAVESGSVRRPGRESAGSASALFPRWVRWLPANRVGAVAAKELRMQWREPRQRSSVIASLFVGVIPVVTLRSTEALSHGMVLVAVFPAMVVSMAAINQYGFDGPRLWMLVAAGDDARSDLTGKNLAIALVAGTIGSAAAVALTVLTGGWEYLAPVLSLIAFAIGLELGIGNFTSVALPVAMPDSTTNVWASNSTQGLQTLGPVFGAMLLSAVFIVPLVLATGVAVRHPVGVAVLVVGEAAGAVGAWRMGLGVALRRSADRQPELLATLTHSR
jgi:ABC-2 type transport system permease protein